MVLPAGLGMTIGLGLAQIIAWSVTYYLPGTLSAPQVAELGLSTSVPFIGTAITFVLCALLVPTAGRLMDRHGARPLLMASCGFIALGLVLQGMATGIPMLALSWIATGIGTSAGLTQAALTAIAQMGGAGAKRLMTILMLVAGLSASIAWIGSQALIDAFGWRICCFILAALQCAVCLPIYACVPRRQRETPGTARPAPFAAPPIDRDQVLIALGFSLHMAAASGISLHLIAVLGHFGAAPGLAVHLSALIGVAQVATRVVELLFGGRSALLNARLGAALVIPSMALVYLAPVTSTVGMLGAGMLMLGITTGIMNVARAGVPLELWGPGRYGTLAGRINAPIMFLMATAPALFSFALDWVGPGGLPALSAGLALLGALALMAVSRPARG